MLLSNIYNVYHQKSYAEKIYQEGFQQIRMKGFELKLLAVYLRDNYGMKPAMIRSELMGFCKTEIDAPERSWIMLVSQAVRYAQNKKNVLIECPYVDMYESEVEFIDSQDISDNAKKVMFAMMVHKKLDKVCYEARNDNEYKIFSYAINKRYSSLKRVAHLSKVNNVADVMHELYCHNLVDVIETRGTPFKMNFVDCIAFDGRIAVRITNYEQLGLYWEWLMGKPTVGLCCTCWKVYGTKSKARCFCDQHQGYQKLGISVREVVCEDCGERFEVSIKNTKTTRCETCQTNRKLRYDAERMMKKRKG